MGRIEAAWPVCWPNGRIDGAFAERNLPEPVFGRGDIMKVAVFSTKSYDRLFLDAANEADGGRHQLHYLAAGLTEQTAPLANGAGRSDEHTSELQSLMRISYAVFCLKTKKQETKNEKT